MSRFQAFLPAVLVLASLFAGCGSENGTGSTPSRAISPSLRAQCPDHPFKEEFRPVPRPKVSAAARPYPFRVEIYDEKGGFVREWEGTYDPTNGAGGTRMVWDQMDARGNPVRSGYYFAFVTILLGEGQSETRSDCFFIVHPDDAHKVE